MSMPMSVPMATLLVMRTAILTREYPPFVYGGAGVHVDFLVRELRRRDDVDVAVHALGEPRDGAHTYSEHDPRLAGANAALRVLDADVAMAAALGDADLLHSHTWYANHAGHLAQLVHGQPHVVTAHSLEPMRPWKAEQLEGGYRLSSWVERMAYTAADAVIAVSAGMRRDILSCYPELNPERVHVVHNGIDTELYAPDPGRDALDALGIDPARPYITFVGRITRQKGVPHLLRAALRLDPQIQLVLLAGAADTAELAAETDTLIAQLRERRSGVHVVEEMLPREQVRQVLTHAAVFCCPSVYEPLGIVNLEAMACQAAVVASDVGGIPEVVVDGVTGTLVHYDEQAPEAFEAGLAAAIEAIATDPQRAEEMGRAGRERAVQSFGWDTVAAQTVEIYRELLRSGGR